MPPLLSSPFQESRLLFRMAQSYRNKEGLLHTSKHKIVLVPKLLSFCKCKDVNKSTIAAGRCKSGILE